MDKPNPKPIDPETPRAKSVKSYRLDKLYPQSMEDDVYSPTKLDFINQNLDKAAHEDNQNSN